MICPKCGFEQPESPDCMRCGILIARFKGVPVGGEPTPPPSSLPPPPPARPRTETLFADPPPPPAGARPETVFGGSAPSGLSFQAPSPVPEREERKPSRETIFDPTAPVQVKTSRPTFLRPLHGSDLIGEAFSIYGANAFAFTLLTGLALSPTLLAQAYLSAQKASSLQALEGVEGLLFAAMGLLVGQPLATAAVTFGVFKQMRHEDTTMGACLGAGLSSLVRVLLVGLFQGLALVLGFLLCIIPGLIMTISLSVAVPAAIEERLGPIESLRRSSDLSYGYRGPIYKTLWTIGGLNFVLTWATELLLVRVLELPQARDIVLGLVSVVITGLSATATAVIYYRLRSVKESIDVDQIASVFA